MTTEDHSASVISILEGFASSKGAGAMVLQGRWGIGKTHLWRESVLPRIMAKPWKKRYSYVSLFGVNSLAELKTALAIATEEFDQAVAHDKNVFYRGRKQLNKWQSLLPEVAAFAPKIGMHLARTIERIGFYLVRDRIICFDDIERKGDGLDLKDFLGLVSFLVEQRQCRIVVILNFGELGKVDEGTWKRMHEKVFDGELTYGPSLPETIELGLSDVKQDEWCGTLRASLLILEISNIRLVRRAVRFMKHTLDACHADDLRSNTKNHIAKALAIMVYCVHGQGESAPPVDMVMHRGLYASHFLDDKNGERKKTWEKWSGLLGKYGFYPSSKMDEVLLSMVENGYPDPLQLKDAVERYQSSADQHERKEAYYNSWRLYHDTVADNGAEIIAAFERTWPPVSPLESPNNLYGVVRVMRMLGRPDLATKFICQWLDERTHRLDELEPHELNLFGRINDEEIQEAVAKFRVGAASIIPLHQAFEMMQESNGYPTEAIASIAAASEQELIDLLRHESGPEFTSTIKKLLNLPLNPAEPIWHPTSLKMRRVCKSIAAMSALNADRIKNWFDIDVDEVAEE